MSNAITPLCPQCATRLNLSLPPDPPRTHPTNPTPLTSGPHTIRYHPSRQHVCALCNIIKTPWHIDLHTRSRAAAAAAAARDHHPGGTGTDGGRESERQCGRESED
jgi:hypothetical protein